MKQGEFLPKFTSMEKKKFTVEEEMSISEANPIVAAVLDIILGVAIYCSFLALVKTIKFGEFFYTGFLSREAYADNIIERISFDIANIPFAILVVIILAVIYHGAYYKKLNILTPGERIVGGILNKNKEKIWENPYYINRSGMFFLAGLSFIILTVYFEGALVGRNVYSVIDIGIKYSTLLLSIFGLCILGKGKVTGACILIIGQIIGYIHSSKLSSVIKMENYDSMYGGAFIYPEKMISKGFLVVIFMTILICSISFICKNKTKKSF